MNKRKLILLGLSLTIFSLMFAPNSISPANAVVGTAGTFDNMRQEVQENAWVSIALTGLTSDADYIITATTGSNIDNITWATGAGQSSASFTRQVARPSGGVVTLTLYGYNQSLGAADYLWNGTHILSTPTVLDSVLVSVGAAENFNVNILTDYIGLFVVGGILVGIVVMFRSRVL